MSDFIEKNNKKEKSVLQELRKDIDEEREDNPSLAKLLDQTIDTQNKIWLIKNKDATVEIMGRDREQSVVNYLIFKKAEEALSEKVKPEEEGVIDNVIFLLKEKYNNLIETDLTNPEDGEIKIKINGQEETINAYENMEKYIVDLDPSYARLVEESVETCFTKYENFEPEEIKDTSGLKIMTLDEVADALTDFTVVNKKLVKRQKNNS